MPPIPTPPGIVTRDDILRAEDDLRTARELWDRVGHVQVFTGDIPDTEKRVEKLLSQWKVIEQARFPLEQLPAIEEGTRAVKRRLHTHVVALARNRVGAWLWAYSAFAQRVLGIDSHQVWVLSLVNGIWGVLAVGLTVVGMGWGMTAFGVLAVFGYLVAAVGPLRPLLRASRTGLHILRADLTYRAAVLRSRIADTRRELARLRDQAGVIRHALGVRRRLDTAQALVLKLRENAVRQADYDRAKGVLTRLRRVLGDVRYDLLATNWRDLRDVPFEDFLVRVFRSLGYQVRTTKRTGDQGVDLIATRGGRALAVQAKGYAGSVGNDAVQQAHTGMVFYRCDECAVITNSRFTRGARTLAARVRCVLIDGDQIPALINGRVL